MNPIKQIQDRWKNKINAQWTPMHQKQELHNLKIIKYIYFKISEWIREGHSKLDHGKKTARIASNYNENRK